MAMRKPYDDHPQRASTMAGREKHTHEGGHKDCKSQVQMEHKRRRPNPRVGKLGKKNLTIQIAQESLYRLSLQRGFEQVVGIHPHLYTGTIQSVTQNQIIYHRSLTMLRQRSIFQRSRGELLLLLPRVWV